MSEIPTFTVGQRVLYVPCTTHNLDRDHDGEHLFHFHALEDSHAHGFRKDDRVHNMKAHGALVRPGPGAPLQTGNGLLVEPRAPKFFWEATIRKVGLPHGVELDVKHPNGFAVHHKPDSEAMWAHEYHQLENVIWAYANLLDATDHTRAEQVRDAGWSVARRPIATRFDDLVDLLDRSALLVGMEALGPKPPVRPGADPHVHATAGAELAEILSAIRRNHPIKIKPVSYDPAKAPHTFHLPGD